MAFQNVTTGDFRTYLTKYGMRVLLNKGLLNNVAYFSVKDDGINYAESVPANSVLIKAVTGDNLKNLYNSGPQLTTGVRPPIPNVDKEELIFIDECNNLEYKNIIATINLGNYLAQLRNAETNYQTISNGYEPYLRLFDEIKVYSYKENAFNQYKLWNTEDRNITLTFNTEVDYKNYLLFDNTHVVKNGNSTIVDYGQNRFKSPFKFSVGSLRSANGVITQNGAATIYFYPVDSFVYDVDGLKILPETLSELTYNNSRNIIPQVQWNGSYYGIKTDTTVTWKQPVNQVPFRFNGLLEAGIVAAKNLFDFYGTTSVLNPNVKAIQINMKVNTAQPGEVKIKDANLTLNLTLDTTETSWSLTGNTITIN